MAEFFGAYPGLYYKNVNKGVLISSKVSDEKMARMMQLLDCAWTDPKIRWQTLYGKEGENWR